MKSENQPIIVSSSDHQRESLLPQPWRLPKRRAISVRGSQCTDPAKRVGGTRTPASGRQYKKTTRRDAAADDIGSWVTSEHERRVHQTHQTQTQEPDHRNASSRNQIADRHQDEACDRSGVHLRCDRI